MLRKPLVLWQLLAVFLVAGPATTQSSDFQEIKLTADDPRLGDQFGKAVAVSGVRSRLRL